jgi:PPP family 3-phenylpropionic acid transporter
MSRSNVSLLSFSYFAFYGVLGLLIPYLSVFLNERGLNSSQIGELMAAALFMRIVAPSLGAWLSHRFAHPLHFMRLASAGSLLAFTALLVFQGYWPMLIVLALVNFFWNASLPQLETQTLELLNNNAHQYARIRVWGSLGFIAISTLTGFLFEWQSAELFVWVGVGILALLLISVLSLNVPERTIHDALGHAPITRASFLKWPILAFWVGMLLLHTSHGPYYTFFLLYLEQVGHPHTLGGSMMSLGVAAEVLTFLMVGKLLRRAGVYRIMCLAITLTVVRWLVLGYWAASFSALVVVQLLHAASFALTHLCAMQFMSAQFTGPKLGTAQALYTSIGFGFGGVLGAWLVGQTWHDGSGALFSFQWAAGLACVSLMMILLIPAHYFSPAKAQPAIS